MMFERPTETHWCFMRVTRLQGKYGVFDSVGSLHGLSAFYFEAFDSQCQHSRISPKYLIISESATSRKEAS